MRLDKYLSHMGFGTRNDVKKLIKNGWVTINDETIKKADYNVKEDDRVCVDDEPVSYVEYEYYILNKPQGYVSATEDMLYPTVMELVQSQRHDLYPVGRLDVDTEGLLLISNDGKLTHEVLSPKKHVDKKYYVEFDNNHNNARILFSNITGNAIILGTIYQAINRAFLRQFEKIIVKKSNDSVFKLDEYFHDSI